MQWPAKARSMLPTDHPAYLSPNASTPPVADHRGQGDAPEPQRRPTISTTRDNVVAKHEPPDNIVVMPRGGNKQRPAWTADQDTVLKALYPKVVSGELTRAALATHVGRSKASCACRAGALGISVKRGQHLRSPETREKISATKSVQCNTPEFRAGLSQRQKDRLVKNGHPRGMLGKKHTAEFCQAQSQRCTGKRLLPEHVLKMLQTKSERYGTLAPNVKRGSWKAGWRKIGTQRIFARSKWEANYARYLQWLYEQGEIAHWQHEPETFWFEKIKRGCRSYLPDFRVILRDNSVEYHEVKGWMDARSKTKIKRMAKYHPNIVLRIFDAVWFEQNGVKLRSVILGWE